MLVEIVVEVVCIVVSVVGCEVLVDVCIKLDGCDCESGEGCVGIEGVVSWLVDKVFYMIGE